MAAIVKIAEFATEGIEVQKILREKPKLVDPTEPILEVEATR